MKRLNLFYSVLFTWLFINAGCSKDSNLNLPTADDDISQSIDSIRVEPKDSIPITPVDSLPTTSVDSLPTTSVDSLPTTSVDTTASDVPNIPDPPNLVKLIIIGGQSLSVGTGAGGVFTNTPIPEAFMLDYGSLNNDAIGPKAATLDETSLQGIVPLQEVSFETQASGIANSLLNHIGGKVIMVSFGAGGKSISRLLSEPYQGNMKKMIKDAVSEVQKMGWQLDLEPLFVWEQGQSDSNTDINVYKQKLGQMISNVYQTVINEISTAQLYTIVAQVRAYGKMNTPIAQIEFTEATQHVALGAVEGAYQMRWPSSPTDVNHLNAQGYRMLGEKNGEKGALLILGQEDKPALMSSFIKNGNELTVKFNNVDSALTIDTDLFSAHPSEIPTDFGFGTFDQSGNVGNGIPQILNVVQKDSDEFVLTMDHMNQPFQLWLGRQPNINIAGSTIVDGADDMAPVHWIEIQ